jgi:hypothetical protein
MRRILSQLSLRQKRRGDYVAFDYMGLLSEKMPIAMRLSGAGCRLYLALLYKWNALHRKERFNMTDEKLMAMTGIKSRVSVLKAKKELEKARLITYYPSNKRFGTTYWITTDTEAQKQGSKCLR